MGVGLVDKVGKNEEAVIAMLDLFRHPGRSRVWRAICEYLQPLVPAEATVMDVGAGYCDFINQIRAREKYAVDLNPETSRWCASDVRFVLTNPLNASTCQRLLSMSSWSAICSST